MTTPQQPRPGLPKGVAFILGVSGLLLALAVLGIAMSGMDKTTITTGRSLEAQKFYDQDQCQYRAARLGDQRAFDRC